MARVETCYTSAACNKCPFAADWGRNGLICYGFSHAIAIYKPQNQDSSRKCCVTQTLIGHSGKVNCVKWISDNKDETEIVSGSNDKTAIVWKVSGTEHSRVATLKGHEGPVTCVTGMYVPVSTQGSSEERNTLIATASTDSTVRIWSILDSEVVEQQIISTGTGFALTLSFTVTSCSDVPMLAFGRDDLKIHLYTMGDGKEFQHVISLTGHEDWVRCLDFATDDNGDILLASCAQDQLIRVWRLKHKEAGYEDKLANVSIADLPLTQDITMKETTFNFKSGDQDVCYAFSLDSVLSGHDNRVYSVRWQQTQIKGDRIHQPMCLLSASMDKTMILWEPDPDSGIWIEKVRVGDVGGNTLGFYGGLFSPCGQSILGHGYQGAFHQWTHNQSTDVWEPQVTGGGHFDSVEDLSWSKGDGDFIISTSKDQTTRLHAPWVTQDGGITWCEIARPQVHGYDLQCLAVLDKYKIASGADEKIVRLFSAPKNFITNFCSICGHDVAKELSNNTDGNLPEGANVPALGLSNKAVFTEEGGGGRGGGGDAVEDKGEVLKPGQYPENYFTALDLAVPPTEDLLLQNTLWPEEGKLYGHGYEIFSLAAHPNGKLVASACKAAKAEVANILLWDMDTKRSVASLTGPALTITQMAFSHHGRYLLAVSRDRTWALFKQMESNSFVWHSGVDKKTTPHSRIIWACTWTHDDLFFLTASRDKKVFAWPAKSDDSTPPTPVSAQAFDLPITAISVAPVSLKGQRYLIASGLENGQIILHTWCPNDKDWVLVNTLNHCEAHHLQINRLTFRPCVGRAGHHRHGTTREGDWLQLASCGADHAVKVFDINMALIS